MCQCVPTTNLVCQTINDISVAQPECQTLPDDTLQVNPFYRATNNMSYWTYKVVSACDAGQDNPITDIYIPVYEGISSSMLTVSERILNCARFEDVPYDMENPAGVLPPMGFNFIHIPIDGRYGLGACAIYRLNIVGNFPAVTGSIYTMTEDGTVWDYDTNYLVPGEPPTPRLALTKDAEVVINGAQATINYKVNVINTGNIDLFDVNFNDMVLYDGNNVVVGPITVDPDTISVTIPEAGTIILTGNIGDILIGETVEITYAVPIEQFNTNGNFVFTSVTRASNDQTQVTLDTSVTIEVVAFNAALTCTTFPGIPNRGNFRISIGNTNGAPSQITFSGTVEIPPLVTFRFVNNQLCNLTFADTGEPVPVNTDISGRLVNYSCDYMVSANTTLNLPFEFIITAVEPSLGGSLVTWNFNDVQLTVPNSQVYIGTSNLPLSQSLDVSLQSNCSNLCPEQPA